MREYSIYEISLIIIYSIFVVIRAYYKRKAIKSRWKKEAGRRERKTDSIILGAVMAFEVSTFIIFIFFNSLLDWAGLVLPDWVRITGIFLGIGSLCLFVVVHEALGRNYSSTIVIKKDHTLAMSGIYKWVRHPMYTAFYILHFAVFMMTANFFIGISWIAGLTILVAYRIPREEALMETEFGEAYAEYKRTTGLFLPRLKTIFVPEKDSVSD
jgi:protein-S-isoprenylcysteine O-methyltransferase Ste14